MQNNYHVFLLDNFDSFTYNLVDQFRVMGCEVTIYRNDLDASYIYQQMQQSTLPPVLILSPGPGSPADAGCMIELIHMTRGHYPILGICLGHQAIVESYQGEVGLAPQTVHGKASAISHTHQGPFMNMINPMPVARYHSLMATRIPGSLSVIARTDNIPMAVLQAEDKVLGFQFHPESVLTLEGETLLRESLQYLTTALTEHQQSNQQSIQQQEARS